MTLPLRYVFLTAKEPHPVAFPSCPSRVPEGMSEPPNGQCARLSVAVSTRETATCPHFPLDLSSEPALPTICAGSDGVDIIFGGKGDDTLSAGPVPTPSSSARATATTSSRFQAGPGGDALRLQNLGFADFWAVRAASVQSGADVRISLSGWRDASPAQCRLGDLAAANVVVDWRLPGQARRPRGRRQTAAHVAFRHRRQRPADRRAPRYHAVWRRRRRHLFRLGPHQIVEELPGGIDTIKTYGVHGYSLATSPEVENLLLLGTRRPRRAATTLDNVLNGNGAANLIDGGRGRRCADRWRRRRHLRRAPGRRLRRHHGLPGPPTATRWRCRVSASEDFAAVSAAFHQVGSEAILDLGDGSTLTFHNTKASALLPRMISRLRPTRAP